MQLPQKLLTGGVLVVDDSDVQRAYTIDVLRKIGVTRITEANDGYVALARLHTLSPMPSVIVVDLEMPMMDGIELIHHIAGLDSQPALIVASGRESMMLDSVQAMIHAMGLPMLGALPKPVTEAGLAGLLAGLENLFPATPAVPGPKAVQVDIADLRNALASDHIVPFFQPKSSLHLHRVQGAEALARWVVPGQPPIPPASFIELAEREGLMPDLTLTILDKVLVRLNTWNASGRHLSVAINLSPTSLGDKLLADAIIQRTEAAQIDSHQIVFEVTESAMMQESAALRTLLRLRLRGFGLAIDDYGTGFSSMQQLSQVPFSELKIDRSLVDGAHRRPHLRTILESAIEMGHRLGMTTVAEGVETREDWALLRDLGCNLCQGYLVSRPVPGDELPAVITEAEARLPTF